MKGIPFLLSVALAGLLAKVARAADILQQLANDDDASNFLEMLRATGLNQTLTASGPFTLFVPTDMAFAQLKLNLTSDKELLTRVLKNHIVITDQFALDGLQKEDTVLNSLAGTPLRINLYRKSRFYRGFVTVNGKAVKKADLQADNGIIHFINEVMATPAEDDIPAMLTASGRFGTLLTAIEMADLGEMLTQSGPFTFFAPTDEAFDRIPQDTLSNILKDKKVLRSILQRHLIPGPPALFAKGISWDEHKTADGEMIATQVFKNNVIKVAASLDSSAFLQDTDLLATNGVVHVIDAVL